MGSSFNFYITSFAGVYGPLDSDRTYSHVSITLPLEAERLQYMLPVVGVFFFLFFFFFCCFSLLLTVILLKVFTSLLAHEYQVSLHGSVFLNTCELPLNFLQVLSDSLPQ